MAVLFHPKLRKEMIRLLDRPSRRPLRERARRLFNRLQKNQPELVMGHTLESISARLSQVQRNQQRQRRTARARGMVNGALSKEILGACKFITTHWRVLRPYEEIRRRLVGLGYTLVQDRHGEIHLKQKSKK